MSESDERKDFVFKITVIGDGGVGKTSLIKKYTKGSFKKEYIKTLGAQFSKYDEKIENSAVKLFFWDIAGQAEFSFMRPTFYKGSKAAIIVFSHASKEEIVVLTTFQNGMKILRNIVEIFLLCYLEIKSI